MAAACPHANSSCPPLAALELLKNAIAKAGYTDKVVIGMDVAASEFFRSGKYDLDFKSADDPSRYITPDQLADLYKSFVKDYPGKRPVAARHLEGVSDHMPVPRVLAHKEAAPSGW